MFRCRDLKKNRWLNDVTMLPDGRLLAHKKFMHFGIKTVMLDADDYIVHQSTRMLDNNAYFIYEGDYLNYYFVDDEGNSHSIIGVVAFVGQLGQYCLFDERSGLYYPLAQGNCSECEIIGNVFDGEKGQQ